MKKPAARGAQANDACINDEQYSPRSNLRSITMCPLNKYFDGSLYVCCAIVCISFNFVELRCTCVHVLVVVCMNVCVQCDPLLLYENVNTAKVSTTLQNGWAWVKHEYFEKSTPTFVIVSVWLAMLAVPFVLPTTLVQSKLLDCFEPSATSSGLCCCERFHKMRTTQYDIRIKIVNKIPKNIGDSCIAPPSTAARISMIKHYYEKEYGCSNSMDIW